jgi:hypothetical protein
MTTLRRMASGNRSVAVTRHDDGRIGVTAEDWRDGGWVVRRTLLSPSDPEFVAALAEALIEAVEDDDGKGMAAE